jgi:valine--pyruvate aminotransferase
MTLFFSTLASRFIGETGTRLLMDDLGEVLDSDRDICNLGGGNPARIPAMQDIFREAMRRQLDDGSFDRLSSAYDGPQGYRPFLRAVAALFRNRFGWQVDASNVAVTAGSQSSFFILFNLLSGMGDDGRIRRLRLPLTPEYIGYGDLAACPEAIESSRPLIEMLDEHSFKYRIDFSQMKLDADTGAVCVSRPTNPTGNVISNEELHTLLDMTRTADVPLIIDNAYGSPFPDIMFSNGDPVYEPHVIYCMSLSKLGLPGLRTGIIIARPEIIDAVRSFNAILTLASSSLGASLVTDLFESGEVLRLSKDIVRPFYQARSLQAVSWCERYLAGCPYRIHLPEGAIFLWLWFPDLPITTQELYNRLKLRNVLVIPGRFFFPGLAAPWEHKDQCLRISYAQSEREVEHGIRVIAEEVRRAYGGA